MPIKQSRFGLTRGLLIVSMAAVTALGLAACSTSSSGAKPTSSASSCTSPKTFTVGVSQPTVTAITSQYAVMQKLGYLTQACLAPKVVFFSTSALVLQAMASGAVDIGMATPDLVIQAAAKGQDVEMAYNWQFKPGAEFAVSSNSSIKKIADLKGKKIGVQVQGSGPQQDGQASLVAAGVPVKDVSFVAVGTGAPAANALTSGQVDALLLFDSLYASMESSAGLNLRIIPLTGPAADLFSTGFVTSHAFAKAHPDIVGAWGRTWAMSTVWSQANPKAAIQMMWSLYPTSKSDPDDTKAMKNEMASFQSRLDSLYPPTGKVPSGVQTWGTFPTDGMKNWIAFEKQYGGLTTAVAPASVYTNKFVNTYNSFDTAAVQKSAKNYKG